MTSKSVSFNQVTIYTFPVILGENPGARSGAPLELDWEPTNCVKVDLDLYDLVRVSERKPRKSLLLRAPQRTEWLLSEGYDLADIAAAAIRVEEIKQQRIESSRDVGFNATVLNALQKTGQVPVNVVKGLLNPFKRSNQHSLNARSA